jgi:3-isopropylmalate dehydrogenase
MRKNIAVILGDGIGPEVTRQAIKVLNAIGEQYGQQFKYSYCLLGADAMEKVGTPLPQQTIDVCLNSDAILAGAIGHPKFDNNPTAKVRPEQGLLQLRKELELFANIRPVTTYPSLHHLSPLKSDRVEDIDFVIYRELTGGIYFGNKRINDDYTEASDDCHYSKSEIERIAHLAFKSAQKRRKKLTLVDKANVLETSRLWRKTIQDIASDYKGVTVEYMFVEKAAMEIILNPKEFDVILTENLLGDIISHQASVLSGSLGLLPSASVGVSTAMFAPVHGSYPQAAGKDIANPVGSILSAALMLDYLNMTEEAEAIREAVDWTQNNGFVTKDINSDSFYFTTTIGDVVSEHINKGSLSVNNTNVLLRKSTII